jgi:hypothetical protein
MEVPSGASKIPTTSTHGARTEPSEHRPEQRRNAWLGWLGRRYIPIVTGVTVAVLAAHVALDFLFNGLQFDWWDWLFKTGIAAFLVGFWCVQSLPERLESALSRLEDRGLVLGKPGTLLTIQRRFRARAPSWAWRCAAVVPALLVLGTFVAFGLPSLIADYQLVVVEVFGGAIAGAYLGRMAANGVVIWAASREGIAIRVKPGHVDGCAGWKPLGDFYFFQALVTATPAVFLATWLVLIPIWPHHRYDTWREPYVGLLFVAIVFEILAFIIPIWSLHHMMAKQKKALLPQADALSQEIASIEAQLADSEGSVPREGLQDRLARLTKKYWDIESMPTWPVDTTVRRRFTLNSVALAIPFVTSVTGLDSRWQDLGNKLADLLSGLTGHGG